MNKELLTLYGARHAVFQIMAKGSCEFAKRLEDGTWEKIGWNDICYLLTDMIDKFKYERSKNILDKIKAQILDEAEYAYADFDRYKEDIMHAEPDELPDDDFRYGLKRALEIINEYMREVEG